MIEDILNYTVAQVKADSQKRDNLIQVYNSIFDDRLVLNCDNCIEDAIRRIKYHYNKQKEKPMEKEKCDFKLIDGRVPYFPALALHITNDNLTNERAIWMIKKNRANLKLFEIVPDNLEELLGEGDGSDATTTTNDNDEPKTVEELVKNNTKAELREMLGDDYPEDANKTDLAKLILGVE